ncbi:hypothetical protein H8E77_17835 [bacterium]|nr:hypothetical protein [bacterium]
MILLAIALALAITFSEILTKYERKLLKHIVNRYLLLYLSINGFLASIVYLILPDVASFLLSENIESIVQSDSRIRALIAGFGYALVLRSKLTDIKIGEHEVPAGFDIIYQALTNYLLRHTERAIQIKEIQILQRICEDFQDINTYLGALDFIIEAMPVSERDEFSTRIQEIREDSQEDNKKCISLAKILLEQLGSEKEVKSMLNKISPVEN